MQRASCFEQVARFHTAKNGYHAQPLFALDRAIPRLFSQDALERVAILFLGCNMTLEMHPTASKVRQNYETTKGRKDDTNIHVLNRTEPPLEVHILYLSNPMNGIKPIEQFQ